MTGLPRFEKVHRVRPVALVPETHAVLTASGPGTYACPRPAPYAAAVAGVDGPATLAWRSSGCSLEAAYDGRRVRLEVTTPGGTSRHLSRRHGRPDAPPAGLALTLTGTHLTAFTRPAPEGHWTARARVDLAALDHQVPTRDPAWLAGLEVVAGEGVRHLRAGAFGQLGLRDLRLVTHADGSPYEREPGDGRRWLTATSAGPGFFDTAHASVWELDANALDLTHVADLYFRRPAKEPRPQRPGRTHPDPTTHAELVEAPPHPDATTHAELVEAPPHPSPSSGNAPAGVYGDHAVHLLRDGEEWLLATSTWGDFDPDEAPVDVHVVRTGADLLAGEHVLDTDPLPLPTAGLRSAGVWDPHLVRTDDGWLVGYVSARRYFDFHPVLATGPSLDELVVHGAATDRRATEGTTLHRVSTDTGEHAWRVLASDGRDNARGRREQYPVFDLGFRQLGTLEAPYPTNIPWPTLVPHPSGDLLVGFDGAEYGGRLLGYGTHGGVVLSRAAAR